MTSAYLGEPWVHSIVRRHADRGVGGSRPARRYVLRGTCIEGGVGLFKEQRYVEDGVVEIERVRLCDGRQVVRRAALCERCTTTMLQKSAG